MSDLCHFSHASHLRLTGFLAYQIILSWRAPQERRHKNPRVGSEPRLASLPAPFSSVSHPQRAHCSGGSVCHALTAMAWLDLTRHSKAGCWRWRPLHLSTNVSPFTIFYNALKITLFSFPRRIPGPIRIFSDISPSSLLKKTKCLPLKQAAGARHLHTVFFSSSLPICLLFFPLPLSLSPPLCAFAHSKGRQFPPAKSNTAESLVSPHTISHG